MGGQESPPLGEHVDLTAGGAEVNAAVVECIDSHGVAQNIHVAILLRKALGERLPLVAAGARLRIDLELAIERKMLRVALDGNDVEGFRLVSVDVDDEAEVGGQVSADLRASCRPRCQSASRPSASA